MIAEVDYVGMSTLLTAASAAIIGIIVAIKQGKVGSQVNRVHQEVKTINSLTLAQLAEAVESRRITMIPEKDRSKIEVAHLHDVPLVTKHGDAPLTPQPAAKDEPEQGAVPNP